MNTFTKNIGHQMTYTENGALTNATTNSDLLNLFAVAGASRGRDTTNLFKSAYMADKEKAFRMLFWLRDIRGGAGERAAFRQNLKLLETLDPMALQKILHLVPEFGRWDDLLVFETPTIQTAAFIIIEEAIKAGNGLAAKWMPRKGEMAAKLRAHMAMTPKQYRKTLVGLTKVVETQMCQKEWNTIDFSKVPSVASARYQKAFGRNAPEKYSEYLSKLESDDPEVRETVKINADTLFPHDVVRSFRDGNVRAAEQQWKALPNYAGSKKILPIVDVSGSMDTPVAGKIRALDISLGLGLYLSEKQTSAFKDFIVTFDTNPKMFELTAQSTNAKLQQLARAPWGGSTDLYAAMELVLSHAIKNNVAKEDMPEFLLVISDMEFNSCVRNNKTNFQNIQDMYAASEYKLPKVVFWNVNARNAQYPVTAKDNNTASVSGYSPSIMKAILSDKLENFTPESVMLETIMAPRYDVVSESLKSKQ